MHWLKQFNSTVDQFCWVWLNIKASWAPFISSSESACISELKPSVFEIIISNA